MGIDFTATALANNIKDKVRAPGNFPINDIVNILTQELHAEIVPLIMEVKSEYLVAIDDRVVSVGEREFDINYRAIGTKLRSVSFVAENVAKEIDIDVVDVGDLKNDVINVSYFQDNKLILFPKNSTYFDGKTLRMRYFRRPNNLIGVTSSGKILAIDTNAKTIQVDNVPSNWSTSITYDIISGVTPFPAIAENVTITGISGDIISFSSLPKGIKIGSWIAESGFSPIAQIPYDVFNLLAQRACIRILESDNDSIGLSNAKDDYIGMVERFKTMVSPRSDANPKKIISGNRQVATNWGWWY